ncbi:QcrA and Rieske domain-containing protein [Thermodesulfovibrio hydrogeniphilus]
MNSRRLFLKNLIKLFFLLAAVFLSIFGFFTLKPSRPKKKEYSYHEIPEEKIPMEGVKRIEIKIENFEKPIKIFLVNTGNGVIALSPVCTHLGCFVNFDRFSNEFVCPCHGGRYDIYGNVLSGPPKNPLQRLPVKIENNKLFVGFKI